MLQINLVFHTVLCIIGKRPEVLKRLEEQGFEIIEDSGYLHITHKNKKIFKVLAVCGLSCLAWANVAADKKIKNTCAEAVRHVKPTLISSATKIKNTLNAAGVVITSIFYHLTIYHPLSF